MKPRITVFMAMSLDGFIADENGDINWLNEVSSQVEDGEDLGFSKLLRGVDLLVMGRNTFNKIVEMEQWVYGDLPVKVITHQKPPTTAHLAGNIEFLAGDPQFLLDTFAVEGVQHIYLDGGNLIQQFLDLDFIDEIILTQVPVFLGSGLSLFTAPLDSSIWKVENQQLFSNGFIQHTLLKTK